MKSIFHPRHAVPLAAALIAVMIIFLAPFWAYQWYQQPFIGIFLEANNVVSLIGYRDWPARTQGVKWPDRLIAVEGEPISSPSDLKRVLDENGYAPLRLTFERRGEGNYGATVLPRRLRLDELALLFGIPYAVGLAFLATGLWAYWLGRQQRPTRAFLLFTASASITTVAFLDMNTTHHFLLGWSLSLPVAAGALAHLALVFPQVMPFVNRHSWTRYILWGLAALVALPAAREILFPTDPRAYITIWRWGYGCIASAMVFFLGTLMVRVFRSQQAIIRQQSRIIIFGTALAFAPILFLYFIPTAAGQVPVFQIGLYLPTLIVLPLTVAYAIVRYRLLDVDRVLSKVVAYGLTTATATLVFYLLITFLSLLLQKTLNANNPLVIAGYLLLLVLLLQPIHNLFQKVIDRFFYRTRADFRRVLNTLSRELVVTPDLNRTLRLLEQELNAALSPERFILYLYDDDRRLYRPHSTQPHPQMVLPPRNPLVRAIHQNPEATWFPMESLTAPAFIPAVSTNPLHGGEHPSPESQSLASRAGAQQIAIALGCQVFVPLRYEGRLIGFLALGPRRSGDPYSGSDLEFLATVAGQSALAVENARLFTNLQRTFDETREMKNLLDDIFASIASGVITTDLQRQITLFNHAAESILGLNAGQVVGNSLPEALSAIGPELDEAARATISQGAATLGQEISPTLPPRGRLSLRLSTTPLRDARLGTKGVTIVIDDLTEQRRLEAEQERIRQTFGRVVAPRVRDRLLADPGNLRLDGVRQPLTVMFADIHQFTPFSERTPPETLLAVLNSYLSLAAQAVLDEEGTLDKFLGDAVMAFWNAPDFQPDHTLRAVRAALAMDQAIRTHRTQLDETFHLYFSIGITRGEAMVGNVGTYQLFNYTTIGDTVNLAQRLESIAAPGQILLSQEAYQAVAEDVVARQLPPVRVKGKQQEIVVYELQGLIEQT